MLVIAGCGRLGTSGSESEEDSTYEPEITYQPQEPLPDSIITYAPFEDTVQPDNSLPDEFDSYSPTGPG